MRDKTINDVYTAYYLNQAGSGFGGVYTSGLYQKGHGIGSFLGGLFRCVFPLLKSGSSAIGTELLKSGANIISDISKNEPVERAIKSRGKQAINNLSKLVGDKMFGSGYKTSAAVKRPHSVVSSRSVKTAKKPKPNKKTKKTQPKNKRKPAKKINHAKRVKFLTFSHNGVH